MAKRLAAIAVAAFAIVLSIDALPSPATAGAADACLSAPTSASVPGQRWHYRLERGSNRRCWYLKGAAQKEAQAAGSEVTKPSTSKATPSQDVAADVKAPAPSLPPDTTTVQTAVPPEKDEQQPAASPSPQPESQAQPFDSDSNTPAAATTTTELTEDPVATTDAATPPVVPDSPISTAPEKPDVEVRMLLLVIVGALAFSGLLASTVFSVARFREKRRQRDANWRAGIANTRRWHAPPLQDNIPGSAAPPSKRVIEA